MALVMVLVTYFKQTRVLMPSKGIAYQPRATPWERGFVSTIRSEGTAHNRFRVYDTGCGVPSEREMMGYPIPRALPWAGVQNPVGHMRQLNPHYRTKLTFLKIHFKDSFIVS